MGKDPKGSFRAVGNPDHLHRASSVWSVKGTVRAIANFEARHRRRGGWNLVFPPGPGPDHNHVTAPFLADEASPQDLALHRWVNILARKGKGRGRG
ncbi:unnamed protein product, partial [Choristocarpus tenellus]